MKLHLIDGLNPAPLLPGPGALQKHLDLPTAKLCPARIETRSPSIKHRPHRLLNGEIGSTKPGDHRAMSGSKMESSPTALCATVYS